MPLDTFKDRVPENSHGQVYVTEQCLDCDLCRDTAPTVFKRIDSEGYSYVHKQPETEDEWEQVRECIEGCCTESIYDDGDQFDWDFDYPIADACEPVPDQDGRKGKPWWRFWR